MRLLGSILLRLMLLSALAGCSQGSAANVQPATTKAAGYASLEPRSGNVPIAPVRIPDARKSSSTSSSLAKENKPANPNIVKPISLGQDEKQTNENSRGNNKGDRGGRGQGRFNRDDFRGNRKNDNSGGDKPSTIAAPNTEKSPATAGSTSTAESNAAARDAALEPMEAVGPGNRSGSVNSFASSSGGSSLSVTYGSGRSDKSFKKPTLPSNIPSWFTEYDKDGDGQVSLHEWPKDRLDEFYKYDRNGDGIITIEEAMLTVPKPAVTTAPAATNATPASTSTTTTTTPVNVTAAPASPTGSPVTVAAPNDADVTARVEQTMQFSDTNKDGFLDAQEIEQNRRLRNIDWKKYDTNKDGKLDKAELTALFKAEGANMGGRGGGGGMAFGGPGGGGGGMRFDMGGGGGRGEGGPRGPGGRGGMGQFGGDPSAIAKVMFDNMDKNKTGKLTKDQLPSFYQNRFGEWDTNKDGFIDFEEFKAGFEKARNNRGLGGGGGRNGPPRGGS